MITGRVFLRDRGFTVNGRQAVMIFGVLGMTPADAALYCAEDLQRPVRGLEFDGLNVLIETDPELAVRVPDLRGLRIDQILCSRIWQI